MFKTIEEDKVVETVVTGDYVRVTVTHLFDAVPHRTDIIEAVVSYVDADVVYDLNSEVIYDPTWDGAEPHAIITVEVRERTWDLEDFEDGDVINQVVTVDEGFHALMKHGEFWVGMSNGIPVAIYPEDILHWEDTGK